MTNESENALPLNESFWEHMKHAGFSIGIQVSENKIMNVITVLQDIYETIDKDTNEAKELIIMMAAILVAARSGLAETVWQELAVKESMKYLDESLKEILDEES